MAQVDFSNARIEPCAYPGIGSGAFSGYSAINPMGKSNVSLAMTEQLWNANGGSINTNATVTQLINQQKQLIYLYQGTFNTSGTEFYIIYYGDYQVGAWKISNISFDSGDTYIFRIRADLVTS